MAWTSPVDFNAADRLLASQLNLIQGNIRYLGARPLEEVTITALSTSSTTYITVDTITITVNTGSGILLWSNTSALDCDVRWTNGTLGTVEYPVTFPGEGDLLNPVVLTFNSPGTYIISLQIKDPTGNTGANIKAGEIYAMEI